MASKCTIEDITESSESEDPVNKVVRQMGKFIDEIFQLKNKYNLSQIVNDGFMAVFADVMKTVKMLLSDGKGNDIYQHFEHLNAYSCFTTCITFIKMFAYHVQGLKENIKKQRPGIIVSQINRMLKKVTDILCNCSKRIEDMGNLVKKMLNQGNDPQDENSIDFGLHFDILVIDLDYCASDLIRAKEEMDVLFSAMRGYFSLRGNRARPTGMSAVVIPVAAIAHFMLLLLPMIGIYCNIGAVGAVAAVDLGILGYMAYSVYENLDFEKDIKRKFVKLDSRRDSLQKILSNLKSKSDVVGNAKKLEVAKDEYSRLVNMIEAVKEKQTAK